jgi:hypothetical protein
MKKITVVAFVSIVLLSFLFLMASSTKTRQLAKAPAADAKGFAVLELFTSQGCSSCPPADELLGQYALQNNKQIIALAFHVDYWNRLGWTDSFSSSKYSQRQRSYAANFNLGSVYTPQLVINGRKELVGSESTRVAAAIENALSENATVQLSISDIKTEGSKIYFNYTAVGEVENIDIKAALVQAKVFTHIKSGENRGLKEMSYNVVRDFVSTAVHNNNKGILSLQLPTGTTIKDFTIVLLAQHALSGNIKGAAQTVL